MTVLRTFLAFVVVIQISSAAIAQHTYKQFPIDPITNLSQEPDGELLATYTGIRDWRKLWIHVGGEYIETQWRFSGPIARSYISLMGPGKEVRLETLLVRLNRIRADMPEENDDRRQEYEQDQMELENEIALLDPDGDGVIEQHVEIRNGKQIIRSDDVRIEKLSEGYEIVVDFAQFDSRVEMKTYPRKGFGLGKWIKNRGGDKPAVLDLATTLSRPYWSRLDLEEFAQGAMTKAMMRYFETKRQWGLPDELRDKLTGRWAAEFTDSGDAVGEFRIISPHDSFHQLNLTGTGHSYAFGTFRTPTGDFGHLAGPVHWSGCGHLDGDEVRMDLSTFDGAHAFLFHARMLDDGTIVGDFWSGNWHHETWTAFRDENAKLPDAFNETSIADESKFADMVFKNLEGTPTQVLDLLDASNAKARVIEVFGTWCPNCADAGRELVDLKSKYGEDLAVVGLAFEITEDFERSVTQVKRYEARMGSDWPILIGGLNDKELASKALPVLDRVRSYPTLIFLNERNEVEAVYTGFSGPATGDAYIEQRERFEAVIEKMINE